MFIPTVDAAIGLDLDVPVRELTAGSTVFGTVLAEPSSDVDVWGCEVALIRTTSYLYRQGSLYGGAASVPTRATEVVVARGVPCAGPLRVGEHLALPFTLDVPADDPGTVSASLVTIQWAVRIRIKVDGTPPKELTCPIVVLSRASDRDAVADAPAETVDRGLVALRFESLGPRRLVPGAMVSGMLALDSQRPGAARGVRVELVLREEVHRGPWIGTDPRRNPADESRRSDTVVARQALAHRIEFDPGVAVALPFLLRAPQRLASPSLRSERFSLSWILRGVVDRALRPDPYVEVQLHAATAP